MWDFVVEVTETAGECLYTFCWKLGVIIDVNYFFCGCFVVMLMVMFVLKGVLRFLNRFFVWSFVSGCLCKWYDVYSSRISFFFWYFYFGLCNVVVMGCDDGVLCVWFI